MITLSRKVFYAVEAVLYIAYNGGTDCVSSREIAEKQNMLPRYLEQIMQKLVKAGILKGMRGPSGGYRLAREKRRITLYEICSALEEGEEAFKASIPSSTALGKWIIAPLVTGFYAPLRQQLQAMTLADLHDQASRQDITKSVDGGSDFTI